ncbi:cytochrome-c3 hydrogenase subunit gamma [Coprothermobacteraceae bacterium]|nr:cytochrome-c3 hydrogenase subunit gamma [Coprothermobacteraceae bacterium]
MKTDNYTDLYKLNKAHVVRVFDLTDKEKLFVFRFDDKDLASTWTYKPGQFVQIAVPGVGESTISITSSATRKGFFELCIRKVGRVTSVIHKLRPGDVVGIRGPYGNGFPMEAMEGKDLLLIASGLGMAPLRGVFLYALDNRWLYGRIALINTARYSSELLFREELDAMLDMTTAENLLIMQTVTREPEYPGLKGRATEYIDQTGVDPKNCAVIVCGPPRMYMDVFRKVLQLGFSPDHLYMTLERRMKCGVGKCGHCVAGTATNMVYMCKDGPVFTYYDIMSTPGLI